MALIACGECGHQVSDKEGSVCPGCGAPVSRRVMTVQGRQMLGLSIAVVGAVIFFVAPHPYGPFAGGIILIIGLIGALI